MKISPKFHMRVCTVYTRWKYIDICMQIIQTVRFHIEEPAINSCLAPYRKVNKTMILGMTCLRMGAVLRKGLRSARNVVDWDERYIAAMYENIVYRVSQKSRTSPRTFKRINYGVRPAKQCITRQVLKKTQIQASQGPTGGELLGHPACSVPVSAA